MTTLLIVIWYDIVLLTLSMTSFFRCQTLVIYLSSNLPSLHLRMSNILSKMIIFLLLFYCMPCVHSISIQHDAVADIIQKEVAKQIRVLQFQSDEQSKRIKKLEETVSDLKKSCVDYPITSNSKKDYTAMTPKNSSSSVGDLQTNEEPNAALNIQKSSVNNNAVRKRLLLNSEIHFLYFLLCY